MVINPQQYASNEVLDLDETDIQSITKLHPSKKHEPQVTSPTRIYCENPRWGRGRELNPGRQDHNLPC